MKHPLLVEKGKSLFGQVSHNTKAYPGFCSGKWPGAFLLLPGYDATPS